MKVCVASAGRFHAFDLARQMERLGHLTRLYTAYPAFKVDGLPRAKVSTYPWLMGATHVLGKLRLAGLRDRMNLATIEAFDRWMADRVVPCEVFHCLSSFGIRSHRAAHDRFGALTVCDRGSSHIVYQNEILREEYARVGIPFRATEPRLIERELADYEFCDLISVPSGFAMRSFVECGVPATKLRLNPYGVDLSIFHPMPKRDAVFRVLFVGTSSVQKGIHYLLEAVTKSRIPNQETWLIGSVDTEIRPFLVRYRDHFRHLGVIPRYRLSEFYSQASVLVLPSVQDGLALVQAQAMACGVPVIATTNTGAEDLFTDGVEGFIVPIRDPAAIAEKLVYLRENPAAREAMGRAALARVQSLGGWDSYGDRMTACYETARQIPPADPVAAKGGLRSA